MRRSNRERDKVGRALNVIITMVAGVSFMVEGLQEKKNTAALLTYGFLFFVHLAKLNSSKSLRSVVDRISYAVGIFSAGYGTARLVDAGNDVPSVRANLPYLIVGLVTVGLSSLLPFVLDCFYGPRDTEGTILPLSI